MGSPQAAVLPPQSDAARRMHVYLTTSLIYVAAAVAEIVGCFAFWAWLRMDKSPLWAIAGIPALIAFAYLLTLAPSDDAGRAYAAYGGIYIAASLLWLWVAEGHQPDKWDLTGAGLALVAAAVILFGPRSA